MKKLYIVLLTLPGIAYSADSPPYQPTEGNKRRRLLNVAEPENSSVISSPPSSNNDQNPYECPPNRPTVVASDNLQRASNSNVSSI